MKKMKITKRIIAIVLLTVMMFAAFSQTAKAFIIDPDWFSNYGGSHSPLPPLQPAPGQPAPEPSGGPYSWEVLNIVYNATTATRISQAFLLEIYVSQDVAKKEEYKAQLKESGKSMQDLSNLEDRGIVFCGGSANKGDSKDTITVEDGQVILCTSQICYEEGTDSDHQTTMDCLERAKEFMAAPIAEKLDISEDDIQLVVTDSFPEDAMRAFGEWYQADIEDYTLFGDLDYFVIDKNTTVNEINEKIDAYRAMIAQILAKEIPDGEMTEEAIAQVYMGWFVSAQAIATTPTQRITYDLTLGKDLNWYMVPSKIEDLTFRTELTYIGKTKAGERLDGKLIDDTYYPQYYENYVSEEDTDATAKITSKTEEDIVAVKIGDKTIEMKEDGTPNEAGWYYPDKDNKLVIAKDYQIEDYDNIEDQGKVKEKVGLVGSLGGEDEQEPSIEWTFRYIKEDITTNPDNSTTIVETTNLPIDPDSIPDGWKPIYDADGITIHRITITIPANKGYDKDVPVNQLRDDGKIVTATTHVTIEPKKLSKTGESFLLTFVAIGIAVFMIAKFQKFKKTNK